MPKIPTPKNTDLATLRWITVSQSITYSRSFCNIMPRTRRLSSSSDCASNVLESDSAELSTMSIIPKPPNLANGRFEANLSWAPEDYAAVKAMIKDLADQLLNCKLPYKGQDKNKLEEVRVKARNKYPQLSHYEKDWATDEFVRRLLKNTSSRVKKASPSP